LSCLVVFHEEDVLRGDRLTEIDDTLAVLVADVTERSLFAIDDSIEDSLSDEVVDILALLRQGFKQLTSALLLFFVLFVKVYISWLLGTGKTL
jgi:hypothetical protein